MRKWEYVGATLVIVVCLSMAVWIATDIRRKHSNPAYCGSVFRHDWTKWSEGKPQVRTCTTCGLREQSR